MSILDILWLFFIFTALQPILSQRILEAKRFKLISILEKRRKSRVITLIHRQETMSILGFPIFRYIDINDSEEVIKAIRMTPPDMPIDIILHTPGGLVLAAIQIAHALMRHPAKVSVFIPFYAMSGGTFIALAGDEIFMDEHAVLGPVDPQLGEYPAASILKVVSQKDKNELEDKTLILADVAKKAINQLESEVTKLLKKHFSEEEARELATILSSGKWTHDYPISFEEAKRMGLLIRKDIPQEIYQLMELYPQPLRKRSAVEYIPFPYLPKEAKK
ncbi:MAG TPA: hypothetical protein ENG49_01465 [Candidatus Omnitrophica bacterium]|nr:hypothetical protein [Candidatus Omnitrophota bacterium]